MKVVELYKGLIVFTLCSITRLGVLMTLHRYNKIKLKFAQNRHGYHDRLLLMHKIDQLLLVNILMVFKAKNKHYKYVYDMLCISSCFILCITSAKLTKFFKMQNILQSKNKKIT